MLGMSCVERKCEIGMEAEVRCGPAQANNALTYAWIARTGSPTRASAAATSIGKIAGTTISSSPPGHEILDRTFSRRDRPKACEQLLDFHA